MRANDHPRNADRLDELASYDILDTETDPDFDRIVGLVAAICDVPVCLVSFVDAARQWFKAETGMGTHETDLERSICAHAILQEELFEIEDTTADARTADNPIVAGPPHFRFYAGMPIVTESGLPLGTLCVLDHKPRKLTDVQRQTLAVLAGEVMSRLEARRNLALADMQRKEIDHRVKNSLQSIASYARLLGADSGNAETKQALTVLRGRIETIAALHEALYATGTGSVIDLGAYLSKVAALLSGHLPPEVSLSVEAAPVDVHSRIATACAVILNEVVANAAKHAFPDGRAGSVTISGVRDGDHYILAFADDGVGMTAEKTPGLGLRIIEATVAQMGGTYEDDVPVDIGHRLIVRLPLE